MLMDKISEYSLRIKQNLPELAFLLFSTRLIFLGANIGDSLALVSITGLLGYKYFLTHERAEMTKLMAEDIANIKNHIQALNMKHLVKRADVDETEKKPQKRYF